MRLLQRHLDRAELAAAAIGAGRPARRGSTARAARWSTGCAASSTTGSATRYGRASRRWRSSSTRCCRSCAASKAWPSRWRWSTAAPRASGRGGRAATSPRSSPRACSPPPATTRRCRPRWREAWNWARLKSHLDAIEAREELLALAARRRELEAALGRLYARAGVEVGLAVARRRTPSARCSSALDDLPHRGAQDRPGHRPERHPPPRDAQQAMPRRRARCRAGS